MPAEPAPDDQVAIDLGRRLRAVREDRRLSLNDVDHKSGGRWKAVVVGSYERGDRHISAVKLVELAAFYGVPVADLYPGADLGTQRVVGLLAAAKVLDEQAAWLREQADVVQEAHAQAESAARD